ncbi:MAG: JAB domain-containing protein [SAR202 cluster bacterium]|nr:JAB domain-containing protein [SAR202 cluster bacterium]
MIRDMAHADRPRDRLMTAGPGALSNSELIAILLRTGVEGESVLNMAGNLIAEHGGLGGLARVTYGELCRRKGISEAKACQLLVAFELGKRVVALSPEDRKIIRSPQDVSNLLSAEMRFFEQEHLRVMLLTTRAEVKGFVEVYKGNVNMAVLRVAEVMRPAIRENCPSIIIVHNYPSGDPSPSPEDILVTRKLTTAAQMMDIEVLDHIIIGGQSFVSLKEKGLGFTPKP